MSEKWVQVEDDPNIIDAEVDEAIQLLENLTYFGNYLINDVYYHEEIIPINQNVPVPSFLDAKISVDVLRNYCKGLKVPTKTQFLLDQFAQQIRAHRSSTTKKSPTIDIFFGSNTKLK